MKLTTEQVRKVAKLANLPLKEDTEEKYSSQMTKILDYIDKLNEVNTDDVIPTYNITGKTDVFRDDVVGESLTQEEVLKNSKSSKEGFFVTKGVFEDE